MKNAKRVETNYLRASGQIFLVKNVAVRTIYSSNCLTMSIAQNMPEIT